MLAPLLLFMPASAIRLDVNLRTKRLRVAQVDYGPLKFCVKWAN